jgi:hypothetical protein
MTVLLFIDWTSVMTMLAIAIVSFGLGLLYKIAVVTKQRKRILRLEDEMLSNHASILQLEKKLGETNHKEKNGVQHDITAIIADRELRVS